MAITEASILAAISTTEAKLAEVIAGMGVQGDYKDGDVGVERSAVIVALEGRLKNLYERLNAVPAVVYGVADIRIDEDTGEDTSERIGDLTE